MFPNCICQLIVLPFFLLLKIPYGGQFFCSSSLFPEQLQQSCCGFCCIKKSMQIRSRNRSGFVAVTVYCAVCPSGKWYRMAAGSRPPHMTFIARNRTSCQRCKYTRWLCNRSLYLLLVLLGLENGFHVQQSKPSQTAAAFGLFGVGNLLAQHLKASADSKQQTAFFMQFQNGCF